MVFPGDDFPGAVDRCLQVLEPATAIVVMPDVVLTAPHQLDGRAYGLRNPRRLAHRIVVRPAAESSTGAHHAKRHVVFGDAQQASHRGASGSWKLAGGPDFDFAVLVMRRAVLRLHRAVGDVREDVRRFHHLDVVALENGATCIEHIRQEHGASLHEESLNGFSRSPGVLESRGSPRMYQKHRLTHLSFSAREPQCGRHAVPFAEAT